MVVGAPNIEDFAPSPGSILHIKELEDVQSVAKRMKYLAENPDAYNQSLRCGSTLGMNIPIYQNPVFVPTPLPFFQGFYDGCSYILVSS